jgi:diacylglycerol O-acyltransferase
VVVERLTAADAWFLYVEGPTLPVHVTGLLILDPATSATGFSFERMRQHIAGRLDVTPELRRRLVEVPLAIDHPCWIEDPAFELDQHVHHLVLPGVDSSTELARFIGDFASSRLDRTRPLWDLVVVEGLDGGRFAVIVKMHHCEVDGVSGLGILEHLLELSPTPEHRDPPPHVMAERLPSIGEVLAAATWNRVSDPLRPVRAAVDAARSLWQVGGTTIRRRRIGADPVAHPLNAPRTGFNSSMSAKRVVAFGRAPLDDLKAIRRAFDVTINDVVLAACTHGLRDYMACRELLPDRPLVCSVPCSTHGHDDRDLSSNQVSNMFVNLPVQVADPLAQLRMVHAGSCGAKEVQESIGANMISDVVEIVPPSMIHLAMRLYSESGLADRVPPIHNLIVSNVMGSPAPMYLAGSKVVGLHAFGPLMLGAGLNITVLSHDGEVGIGLTACPDVIADVDELLEDLLGGIAVLLEAAGGVAV